MGGTRNRPVNEFTETLNGVRHSIYRTTRPERAQEWEIPEGRYLMMGDNRDMSEDSRVWGLAHESNIVGKAVAIWMHKDPGLKLPTFERNQWLN